MYQIILSLVLLPILLTSDGFSSNESPRSADEILQKTVDKLASLKSVSYSYQHEYNYKSEAYFAKSDAVVFIDFDSAESNGGARWQMDSANAFIAYNGSQSFHLNKKDKTMKVTSNPSRDSLSSSTYLQFGLPMWRNALPKIIRNEGIAKSLETNEEGNYVVEFSLDKAFIESGLGTQILPMSVDRKTVYRLTIDKNSFLPIDAFRGNDVNEDFNKATFSEVVPNPTAPAENSWYYSTFSSEYKYVSPTSANLIKAGSPSHDFSLPLFGSDKAVSGKDYAGRVTLLEFWIFHCGACQAAVPKLNELKRKYANTELEILAVNFEDTPRLIELFADKFKPEFPILYNGASTAKQFGVTFYPTIVLVGKDGKVRYSGEFDVQKIDELIKANLR